MSHKQSTWFLVLLNRRVGCLWAHTMGGYPLVIGEIPLLQSRNDIRCCTKRFVREATMHVQAATKPEIRNGSRFDDSKKIRIRQGRRFTHFVGPSLVRQRLCKRCLSLHPDLITACTHRKRMRFGTTHSKQMTRITSHAQQTKACGDACPKVPLWQIEIFDPRQKHRVTERSNSSHYILSCEV